MPLNRPPKRLNQPNTRIRKAHCVRYCYISCTKTTRVYQHMPTLAYKLKPVFIYLWLLCGLYSSAQTLPRRLYTPHDGLPQSQVTSIFQDSRGYIWVGTQGGLAYFDGVRFNSLTAKDGLPYEFIRQIMEAPNGDIVFYTGRWRCTYDGRSVAYDTVGLRSDYVFANWGGKRWAVSTKDSGLYWTEDDKRWTPATQQCPELDGKKIRGILVDQYFDRLLLLESDSSTLYAFDGHLTKIFSDRPYHNFRITGGARHCAPVIFADSTVWRVEKTHSTFLRQLPFNGFHSVQTADGQDTYYTALFGSALYRSSPNGDIHVDSLGVFTDYLFLDRDENLWVSTEQGLLRIFTKGFINYSKTQLDGVWSMAEDNNGHIWFGEFYNKILKQLSGARIVSHYAKVQLHPRLEKGQFPDFYFGGGRDKEGILYFSTYAGILRYDFRQFSILDKNHEPTLSLHFYLDTVRNIIVSGTEKGINIIDLKTGATDFFGKEAGLSLQLNVLGVTKDQQGRYWIGTGRGIAVFDYAQRKYIKHYTQKDGNYNHYSTRCIYADDFGNVWAGSANALLWHDPVRDAFVEIAPDILKKNINSIVGYQQRYLIIGCNDGIYTLDLQAFCRDKRATVRHFNQYNGYTGIEPNQNCLFVDSKGGVWVAASDIVTRINPAELDMTAHPLTVYITEINNERLRYADYGGTYALGEGVTTAKIRFEAVGFERPGYTEFSYLQRDGTYSAWFNEDFTILDNLSSGTYPFTVRTRPTGSVDEADIRTCTIYIKVSAPLTKEWWFPWLMAFVTAFAGVGVVLYIWRMRQRARRKDQAHAAYIAEQEERDRERTRQNKYLQIQTLQAQLNPHFVFNLLQAVQTRIYEGNREAASGLIVNLGHLIRRFLESSVNMDLMRSRNSEITIQQEIELLRSYIEFEQLQYNNSFDYDIHVSDDLDVEIATVPPMLIQPYVENAIKHGVLYEKERRCRVDVSFTKTADDQLCITIADDGVGRDKAKEIQEKFIRMYKSRGTQILEDRIKIMQELGVGIRVETKDKPDHGTIVTLFIDM
jgi:ligand-binding sensor domain-containing protein/two-component sensor histidine kinase